MRQGHPGLLLIDVSQLSGVELARNIDASFHPAGDQQGAPGLR